jgi:hypothetical protein
VHDVYTLAVTVTSTTTVDNHNGVHTIITVCMLHVLQVLFSIPAEQVAARLEALPAALGVTEKEALRLAQDWPRFLLVQTATVAEGWRELRRAASKRPEWREQIGDLTASSVQTYVTHLMVCVVHVQVQRCCCKALVAVWRQVPSPAEHLQALVRRF